MWRELTEADVLGVLNATETSVYQTAVAGDGQDVLADIIGQVVNHCRGYIADNPANKLAAGITLPERAIRPALHLIRKDLLTRLDLEVSEDRRKDASEALRFFERGLGVGTAAVPLILDRHDGEWETAALAGDAAAALLALIVSIELPILAAPNHIR